MKCDRVALLLVTLLALTLLPEPAHAWTWEHNPSTPTTITQDESNTTYNLTKQESYVIASIVTGEYIRGSYNSALWAACTIRFDLERGYSVGTLHPGRWHGYSSPPTKDAIMAVERAFDSDACEVVPTCMFLGNGSDGVGWRGKPGRRHRMLINGRAMVCIEPVSIRKE
jgi:hypothetical protein